GGLPSAFKPNLHRFLSRPVDRLETTFRSGRSRRRLVRHYGFGRTRIAGGMGRPVAQSAAGRAIVIVGPSIRQGWFWRNPAVIFCAFSATADHSPMDVVRNMAARTLHASLASKGVLRRDLSR